MLYMNNKFFNIKMLLEHLDLLSRFPLVQWAALWLLRVQMHIFPHIDYHISRTGLHIFAQELK